MMKKTILFSLLCISSLSIAANTKPQSKGEILKAVRQYQRLMDAAHPTPDAKYLQAQPKVSIFQSPEDALPKFFNSNTIDAESQESSRMQNESSVAVNPTNPKNLIASAVDYRANSSTWVYVSDDGGYTWRNINLGKPFPDWRSSNDPSVYFATDGTGYLCYGGFGENLENSVGENAVFIAKTTDEGKTWKAHIPVILHKGTQTLDSLFEDKYYVQVDNSSISPYFSHLYIPWKRVSPRDSATQIVLSKSIDKGETWTTPINISHRLPSSSEDTTFGQSFPISTTGPNGEVYVAWNHGIEHGIGFAKSTDGGATFSEPRIIQRYNIFGTTTLMPGDVYRHTVKKKVRAESYPTLICDNTSGPRSGYLYLTWAADKYPNIYFSRSTDFGATWSAPVIVHSDTTNDQFWQWMSLDPTNGDLAIMYFDSRNDTSNLLVECYVSYSSDGGLTWTDKKAADQKSDLRLNPFTASSFAGDYSGSAFYDGMFYPTWVDMRNAVLNINDSDVFSAVINTQAPNPIENLRITIIPEEPTKLEISWTPPRERSFGQPLLNNEYKTFLFRNDTLITELNGGITEYSDTQLTPYTKYNYTIRTVSDNDSSIARTKFSYSGGAKEPASAQIIRSNGSSDNSITFDVKLPNKRADGETILSNLNSIDVYRDKQFLKNIPLQVSDTSKVISLIDPTGELGYYTYYLIVKDSFGNISELSAPFTAFSGVIEYKSEISEYFDNDKLAKFFISGSWVQTNEISLSQPYSLSNAPFKNYENGQLDTLMLFPIVTKGENFSLNFAHCAFIATFDYGTVEYSTDNGNNWSDKFGDTTAKWTRASYPAWKDNQMNELDWKPEQLPLPITNDTILIRFRFYSNNVGSNLGWYLDNIVIKNTPASIEYDKISENQLSIYPNPASNDYLNLKFMTTNIPMSAKYRIVNSLGQIVNEGDVLPDANGLMNINAVNFDSGIYYITIYNSDFVIRKSFSIIN